MKRHTICIVLTLFTICVGIPTTYGGDDVTKELARACRDLAISMMENRPSPYTTPGDAEKAMELVARGLATLEKLKGNPELSAAELVQIKYQIDQCNGALKRGVASRHK
jgi:hypothetical protein